MNTAMLSPVQIKKHLGTAVQSLTFCHAQEPGMPDALPYAAVMLDDGREVSVDLVSPGASGLTPEELVKLFDDDQKRRSRAFTHPALQTEDEELFDGVPLHAQDLIFRPDMFITSGIEKDKASARYCLLAKKRGRIVGMVAFRVDVSTFDDACLAEPDVEDMRLMYFNVNLDLVYVCSRHRNKGYGKALMGAVAEVFYGELHHLSRQLAPVAALTGERFELQPYLYSEWVSGTGKLAHLSLLEEMDIVIDTHKTAAQGNEPERKALDVPHAQDDAGY